MPEKKSKPSPPKARAAGKPRPGNRAAEDQRPPDSAEDFEHVLRRLVAQRDRRSGEKTSA